MSFKVSVIIPCFNAENTIERAIHSVMNQTIGFNNIELLLYDDASTDNTPNIIKDYSKKYDNIISICSEKNSGRPSKGRNVCIERASSEFLMFMDNDDEYDAEICQKLYDEMFLSNSELVTCSFINIEEFKDNKVISGYVPEKAIAEENKLIFLRPNIFYFKNIYVWNTIFRKNIIVNNEIYFPEDEFAEDVFFSQSYKLFVSKAVYLKNYFGVYRHVQYDSLSNSFNFNDLKDIHETHVKLYMKLKNYNLPFDYIFEGHIVMTLVRLYKSDALNYPVNDVIDFLEKIRDFEIESNISIPFWSVIGNVNYFLMKERYYFVIFMFKLLNLAFNSKILRRIYSIF